MGCHNWADGQILNIIQFWAWTGLRTSEIVALEWGDLDKSEVNICRALVEDEIKGPKTEAGYRAVLLLPPARDAIKAQRKYTYFEGNRVFHNPQTNSGWRSNKAFRVLSNWPVC